MSCDYLDVGRLQHTFHRFLYIVHQVIYHLIVADVHSLVLGNLYGSRLGASIESEDDTVRSEGEEHIALCDTTTVRVQDVNLNLVVVQALQGADPQLQIGIHRVLDKDRDVRTAKGFGDFLDREGVAR